MEKVMATNNLGCRWILQLSKSQGLDGGMVVWKVVGSHFGHLSTPVPELPQVLHYTNVSGTIHLSSMFAHVFEIFSQYIQVR